VSDARRRAERILSSWSHLYEARERLRGKYREVWDLPIKRNREQVLLEELRPGSSVLEIGSSDRRLEPLLTSSFEGLEYRSMDTDRETRHDFYDLDEVEGEFDAVLLFEVIEHLPFEEGVRLAARIFDLLRSGGKLVTTTPNVAHPTHFYRDPAHVAAWSHEGLGGVLLALGFEVAGMYRLYAAPAVRELFRRVVAAPLHRYFGVDFAHTLLVVARRPGK